MPDYTEIMLRQSLAGIGTQGKSSETADSQFPSRLARPPRRSDRFAGFKHGTDNTSAGSFNVHSYFACYGFACGRDLVLLARGRRRAGAVVHSHSRRSFRAAAAGTGGSGAKWHCSGTVGGRTRNRAATERNKFRSTLGPRQCAAARNAVPNAAWNRARADRSRRAFRHDAAAQPVPNSWP